MNPQKGEVWQHYKTKEEYEIVGTAQMQVKVEELDMKECVIYQAISDKKLWVRPLTDFVEKIEFNGVAMPRFAKVR